MRCKAVRLRPITPFGAKGKQQSRQPVTLEIAGAAPVGPAIYGVHASE